MDNPSTNRRRPPPTDAPGPAVVHANWFQFEPGESVEWPRVESRMLLWCAAGAGSVAVDGTGATLGVGDWLFLPWMHRIAYRAATRDPFLIGGIHLIPRLASRGQTPLEVAHSRKDPLAGDPARADGPLPGLDGLVAGHCGRHPARLLHFASYAVELFQSSTLPPERLRGLAETLIEEIRFAALQRPGPSVPIPGALRLMQEFARAHVARPIRVEDLACAGNVGTTTVHRLFQEFESMPPGLWVARMRAAHAARLLVTTTLPVGEIARRSGFDDPFHFSRFFKKHRGVSPRGYRTSHAPL